MYSPFTLKVMPMERLFLINFEKDPDAVYIGFEPQWFDDAAYGTGLRIIAWRKDGYVDVYQQPGLTLEDKLDVAAKGLAESFVRPLSNARFEVTASGIDVAFAFEDKTGRAVEVEVVERSKKATRPFPLLAPVGSSSTHPSSLPVYFMYDFYFVRRAHTAVTIRIAGRQHRPDPFVFPLGGARVYFMRYSADTFLVDWCPAQSKALEALQVEGAQATGPDQSRYELVEDAHGLGFARIHGQRKRHAFVAEFTPPFPEITRVQENASLQGAFVLGADASVGVIRGTYRVSRRGDEVEVILEPNGGWEPRPQTLFLRFLFTAAKVFRQWPKTYRWTAKIKVDEKAAPFMVSQWTRI